MNKINAIAIHKNTLAIAQQSTNIARDWGLGDWGTRDWGLGTGD
ncbi:hypothetical protein [Nostoc sp.]